MPVDFDALRGNGRAGASEGVPEDGLHICQLLRARLNDARGSQLVTEWQDDESAIYWTSWDRLDDPQWIRRTASLLNGLGVDLTGIDTEDELGAAVQDCEGRVYQVRTEARRGRDGDRWFITTFIEDADVAAPAAARASSGERQAREQDTRDRLSPRQQSLTDVPVPDADYQPPADLSDDDIPFLWRPNDWDATHDYNPFAR